MFIVRRAASALLTMLAVSIIVFWLTHALGDPAVAVLGRDAQNPALLEQTRSELGLHGSMPGQYLRWLADLVRGDPGVSYTTRVPVDVVVGPLFRNSLFLMLCALAVALPVSLMVGSYSALRRDGLFDTATTYATLSLAAVPEFAIGAFLVVVFATTVLRVLPAVSSVRGETQPWDDLDGMVLPTVTLALVVIPYFVRALRAVLIEILDLEYIEAARARGVPPSRLVSCHALPNALAPSLQVLALGVGYLVGGVVVVEKVFNYPGAGTLLVEAVIAHNVPVVQYVTVGLSAIYVTCNALADIGTVLVTPRLRVSLR
jgi:peptide/nickel transport system permease protein